MVAAKQEDHWTAEAYQNVAAFVPQLAGKVVSWLDVQEGDRILDLGCGDGVLTHQLASGLTAGSIHGIDSSASMIDTARKTSTSPNSQFSVIDATALLTTPALQKAQFDKVFSNAALHWVLGGVRTDSARTAVFQGVYNALKPGGAFVFEMGGQGNCAEMHAALLMAVGRRVGIERVREVDPWFFPDEKWMRAELEKVGLTVEKSELEYRPTKATEGKDGGVAGWVKLMGKQFFDAIVEDGIKQREEAVKEVTEALETVCGSPSGGKFIGYVRLRVFARKI